MINGVYKIESTDGKIGRLAIALKDGMGIALRRTTHGDWDLADGGKGWFAMSADQLAQLEGWGLDACQIVVDSSGRTLEF